MVPPLSQSLGLCQSHCPLLGMPATACLEPSDRDEENPLRIFFLPSVSFLQIIKAVDRWPSLSLPPSLSLNQSRRSLKNDYSDSFIKILFYIYNSFSKILFHCSFQKLVINSDRPFSSPTSWFSSSSRSLFFLFFLLSYKNYGIKNI
jgi:hypothetical protein